MGNQKSPAGKCMRGPSTFLGVGFDTTAEAKFLKMYPKCRFLAADPQAARNKALVEKLNGTFVNAAVAGETGVHTAGVFGISKSVFRFSADQRKLL